MENWITGLSLVKSIVDSAMGNTDSKQDVRRLVQEELHMSQNREHSEILRDILKAMEDKSDKREEEMNLRAKVEELTQRLEKFDHEKKHSETRMWMRELLEKMIRAGAERSRQYKQEGRERGRGKGRPPQSFRPHYDVRNDNDHLPWTDGPKGRQNHFPPRKMVPDDNFVFVNRDDIHFDPHRSRNFHRGGFQRNRGQHHHSFNRVQPQQEGERTPQQNTSWRGHNNNQQRGSYRGQGRGAIPKSSGTRTSSSNVHGNQGTDEIHQLTAKLLNLSTGDEQLTFTREEVIAIKNALKEKHASENQQKGKAKKQQQEEEEEEEQEQEQEQKQKKNKNNKKKKNKPQAAPAQREEDKDATENPSSEVLNLPPPTTPSQVPVQMLPLPGFDDSVFQLLPANQVLEDAMLVAKEGGRMVTLQPRTIQEMKDFKSKYPNAEVFALKPSGS